MRLNIEKNGQYRLTRVDIGITGITAEWATPEVAPAGVLTFSVDGDEGEVPGVITLANGERALAINMPVPFVDVVVTGLPTGGRIVLWPR